MRGVSDWGATWSCHCRRFMCLRVIGTEGHSQSNNTTMPRCLLRKLLRGFDTVALSVVSTCALRWTRRYTDHQPSMWDKKWRHRGHCCDLVGRHRKFPKTITGHDCAHQRRGSQVKLKTTVDKWTASWRSFSFRILSVGEG